MIIFGSSLSLPYDLLVELGSPIWTTSVKRFNISEKYFQEMARFTWIRDTNTNGSILPKNNPTLISKYGEVALLYLILWPQTANFCCLLIGISCIEIKMPWDFYIPYGVT